MAETVLARTTFQSSRVLEFFTEDALQMHIGFPRLQWPLALIKELLDNALDACETARVLPEIDVVLEQDAVSVRDNGPGIPATTVERSLDYLLSVSDKMYYISPTRGRLGNALKCVWAAPYVIDGAHGHVEVATGGVTHCIDATLDRLAQQPVLRHTVQPDGVVKIGTGITMDWPGIARSLLLAEMHDFYNVETFLQRYATFNPHATFHYRDITGQACTLARQTSTWTKWVSSRPTSPHWYTVDALRALIAAYLVEDRTTGRVRTVREFVAEFAGLKGTLKQKAVTEAAGLSGRTLADLVAGDNVAEAPVRALLAAMRQASRLIKPRDLGVLGEDHLTTYLTQVAHIAPESIQYKKGESVADGLPYVAEVACGWSRQSLLDHARQVVVGLNWSPTLRMPVPEINAWLGDARIDSFDPVVLVLHLACPHFTFTDRGKTTLALPEALSHELERLIMHVTKPWKAMKRHADNANRVRQHDLDHWHKMQTQRPYSVKEAAYEVMEQAYLKASGNGTYPANARQIMYAARPLVLERTGGLGWKHSSYFTQTLLPDFLDAYPELTADWDVVFDARGHLHEPHTNSQLGLGTLEVRHYLEQWHGQLSESVDDLVVPHDVPTCGPQNRYHFALFVEKEGFNALLNQAQIAERYDLAIMSTKGMSVTAARHLVAELSEQGVTIVCMRDFDKAGFAIVHTLRTNTRRWQYRIAPTVVDIGLRLDDVETMGLQSEYVTYNSKVDPRSHLLTCGATRAESNFLVKWHLGQGWAGDRVELNAMDSVQFIAWLEAKLQEVGVQKVVPDPPVLERAYRRMVRLNRVQQAIETAMATMPPDAAIPVPANLAQQVRTAIDGTAQPWDEALWRLVSAQGRRI